MRINYQPMPNQAQETIMVKDLQRVVLVNELQGRELLKESGWNLNKATNLALEIQTKGQQVEQQFNRYLEKNETQMAERGIQSFCLDLGIDIMDPIILYISFIFKAEKMGIYTKFDFLYGFQKLRCSCTQDLKRLLPKLREEFRKQEVLKSVYRFCFDFSKTGKDLDYPIAQGLWEALLKNEFQIMNKFLEYAQSIPENLRPRISRDTYYMVWEFCIQIGSDLSKYDYLTGAWPTFIDGFYFYVHPEHKPK